MLDIENSGLLILSDIHACSGDASSSSAESYVSTNSARRADSVDPFDDLERLLQNYQRKLCAVICPGDLTNKADEKGVGYVWDRLQNIAKIVNAPLVIATPGNHDLNSRYAASEFDARGIAMLQKPPIPNGDRANYLEYWAEHFTIFERVGARFVAINSSAYHGGGLDPKREMEQGRISDPTLTMLAERLKEIERCGSSKKINILILHHHPLSHDEIVEDDYSALVGGGKLLRLLDELAIGPWLIIHGHKHRPRLLYGPGTANPAIILGAASFSAQINRDANNKSPNQFHIVEISQTGANAIGVDIAGTVSSWNWTPGQGWEINTGAFGLPSITGFGYRGGTAALNGKVTAVIAGKKFQEWPDLCALVPELNYLLPTTERQLIAELKSTGVQVLFNEGRPAQLRQV